MFPKSTPALSTTESHSFLEKEASFTVIYLRTVADLFAWSFSGYLSYPFPSDLALRPLSLMSLIGFFLRVFYLGWSLFVCFAYYTTRD